MIFTDAGSAGNQESGGDEGGDDKEANGNK